MKKIMLISISIYIAMVSNVFSQDTDVESLEINNSNTELKYHFNEFIQFTPNFNVAPKFKTKASIFYDEEYLYARIDAFQPDSVKLYSMAMERDNRMDSDDHLDLIIDSYNDQSNALLFRVNSIGTQMDAEINNNGLDFNYNWNTYWFVDIERTITGWVALFKIPFSSLRFKVSDAVNMGIKIVRYSKSINETSIFPLIDELRPSPHTDCSNMEIISLSNLHSKKPIYITPYIKSNYNKEAILDESTNEYFYNENFFNNKNYVENNTLDKVLSNIGLDVKIKPKTNQTIDLTLNTDFSQIEADDRIINLTRYSIAIPEKRSFFLEGSETFNSNMFGHRLFHSRRIGIEDGSSIPLIGGVKYTGGTEAYQFGILSMQSANTELGAEDSKNYTVARFKKAYGKKDSYAGVLITNKQNVYHNNFNRVIAIDGISAIGDVMKFEYFLGTSIDTSEFNQDNLTYGVRLNRFPSKGYHFDYRFREYRENFDPAMGFLPRNNNKRFTINQGYKMRPEKSEFWSVILTGIYLTQHVESSTNKVDMFQINGYFHARDKHGNVWGIYIPMYNSDKLYTNWKISESVSIPEGNYKMWSINPSFTSGNSKSYKYNLNVNVGQFYGGNKFIFNGGFQYFISKYWNFETFLSYNYIEFPKEFSFERPVVERLLLSSRLNIFLSPKFSIKTYFQYDNLSKTVGSNLRFRYHHKEGSDLYLVFNQDIYSGNEIEYNNRPDVLTQNIAIKYTYTILN